MNRVRAKPLAGVTEPGDKGMGIRELEGAGLRTPRTLVASDTPEPEPGEITGIDEVFRYLGLPATAKLMVRPSLRIRREDAPGVSGLYPSRVADYETLGQVLDQMGRDEADPDRVAERLLIGEARASRAACLLIQELMEPDWSGVAHVAPAEAGVRVTCGLVEGHLSRLVEGEVRGRECELAQVDLQERRDVALIADEEDLTEILTLDGARSALAELYHAMRVFQDACGGAREVEWVFANGQLTYLQSQPMSADD
jgi:hypothetical protein